MTDRDFDRPGKGRVARRRAFYLHPELETLVSALPIAAQCTTSHGTWHTLLVGTLLRALLAGDVRDLERHLEATMGASKESHSKAQEFAAPNPWRHEALEAYGVEVDRGGH